MGSSSVGVATEIGGLLERAQASPASGDHAWSGVVNGDATPEEVRRLVRELWAYMLELEQVTLARLLRAAPTLQNRVAASALVSRAFGGGHADKTHTTFLKQ